MAIGKKHTTQGHMPDKRGPMKPSKVAREQNTLEYLKKRVGTQKKKK